MNEYSKIPTAGFIGLGAMGAPMARRLASQGYLTHLWNRTGTVATHLATELGAGVTVAASVTDLVARVDVVMTCVSRDEDILSIVGTALPAIRPGVIFVDFSTIHPDSAVRIAAMIRQAGGEFLDVPVTGGVEGANTGNLAMMAGGKPEILATVKPLLDTLATRIVHTGDNGMGQAAKAVNQIMAAGINQAVTEALAFGVKSGLDMEPLIDLLAAGAAGNWFLAKRGRTLLQDRYPPGFKLALHHKDLQICEAMATARGLAIPLASRTRQDYESLMAQGYGAEDISALYRLKQHPDTP